MRLPAWLRAIYFEMAPVLAPLPGGGPGHETDDHDEGTGHEPVVESRSSMLALRIESHRSSMADYPGPANQTWQSPLDRGRRFLHRLVPVAVAVGVSVVLVACVGDAPAVDGSDPALVQGRQLYINNCIGCHGADGGGGTGTKLNEGVVVANYPDIADQIQVVAEGKNAMPAFSAKLTADELEAVTRYTREGL